MSDTAVFSEGYSVRIRNVMSSDCHQKLSKNLIKLMFKLKPFQLCQVTIASPEHS